MDNHPAMTSEIMTIDEVAAYVRVSPKTVYDWAQKGEIPCGKLGNSWRFHRDEIQRWVNRRLGADHKRQSVPGLSLDKVLPAQRILLVETTHKREILDALIDLLAEAPEVRDRAELAEAIHQRETLMSTGIGLGVGVPHCRISSVTAPVMAAATSRSPITDYESLDGQPVHLVFMIAAGRDQHAEHLRLLAEISRRVKEPDVRDRLLQAASGEEFLRIFNGED